LNRLREITAQQNAVTIEQAYQRMRKHAANKNACMGIGHRDKAGGTRGS